MAFGGKEQANGVRTSSTVLLKKQRPQVAPLLANITRLLGKPADHCEDPQCSRYNVGEYYKTHFDGPSCDEPTSREFLMCGGQRLATVLVYLNSVGRGGETAFPLLMDGRMRVAPQRGRALVFFPGNVDGDIDQRLLHEALPAGEVKFVSQVWVRHGVDRYGLFMNTHESQ
jgi:prolyl 4-hydroxylase